jgi:hypothetical protein
MFGGIGPIELLVFVLVSGVFLAGAAGVGVALYLLLKRSRRDD